MKTLFVLMRPELTELQVEELTKAISLASSCIVLNYSDDDLCHQIELLQRRGVDVQLLSAADKLSDSLVPFGEEVSTWIESVRETISPQATDWWFSKLSEMNFSDRLWFDLHRLRLLSEVVKAVRPQKLIWLAEGRLHTVLKSSCCHARIPGHSLCVIPFIVPRFVLFRALGNWFANALSDLFACCVPLRVGEVKTGESRVAVVAGYPNNWTLESNKAKYRFTGNLYTKLAITYFVSLTRRSTPRLRNPIALFNAARELKKAKLVAPVILTERYGSILRVLWEYGRAPFRGINWWLNWNKNKHRLECYGANVWSLFRPLVIAAPLVDWPKNRYWRFCIASACKELSVDTMIVPMFELVEGRAAVAGANAIGVKTLGMQHGSNGSAHRWRFDMQINLMRREKSALIPKVIAVEGEVVAEALERFNSTDVKICLVGAPRIDRPTPLFERSSRTKSILVLGEMHEPNLTFKVALQFGQLVPNLRVILRPHPATRSQVEAFLNSIVSANPDQFYLSDERLLEDDLRLFRPSFIVTGVSGAAVTAAKYGWPVIIVKSNWIPNFSPLLQSSSCEVLSMTLGDRRNYDYFKNLIRTVEVGESLTGPLDLTSEILSHESEEAVDNLLRAIQ